MIAQSTPDSATQAQTENAQRKNQSPLAAYKDSRENCHIAAKR